MLVPQVTLPERLADQFPDDRHNLRPGEPSLLIVEDDKSFLQRLARADAHAAQLQAIGAAPAKH